MIDHTNYCRVVLDGECTCRPGEWDMITDYALTRDPATAIPVRGRRVITADAERYSQRGCYRQPGYNCDCTEEALVPGCQVHFAPA